MKKGFGKKILFLGVSLILFTANVNGASCGGCGTSYHYIEQSSSDGVIGYCVDSGAPGSLKTASHNVTPQRLSGSILDWAQAYNTAKKQQIAYRLIAIDNGLSRTTAQNVCIQSGCYTNDADFIDVYNSFRSQPDKKINRSSATVEVELKDVTKTGNMFRGTIVNNGSSVVKLTKGTGANGVNIVKTTLNPGESTLVTGSLADECEGKKAIINAKSTTSDSSYVPGTSCTNTSGRVEFYYYPGQNGTQGFIIPVPAFKEIPGKCRGGSPGSELPTVSHGESTLEIDLDPEECGNCAADISQNFWCEGGSNQSLKLYETDSILGCVVSGKYDQYCGASIQKKQDKGTTVSTINGQSHNTNLLKATRKNYCSVYCIENIDYDLPGKISAKNGRYFRLSDGTNSQNIKLTGSRTCYTSKIDNQKYANDIIKEQQAIIQQYNLYLKNKAIYDFYSNASNFSDATSSCTTTLCSTDNKGVSKLSTGSTSTYHHYSGTVVYDQYYCTFDSQTGAASCSKIKDSELLTYGDQTTGGGTTTDACGTHTTSCPTVTQTAEANRVEKQNRHSRYERYKDEAKSRSNNLHEIIANYKSCFNWTNNYCFNPKIKFTYDDGDTYKLNEKNNYLTGNSADAMKNKTGDVSTVQENEKTYFESVNNKYEGSAKAYSETQVRYIYINGDNIYSNAKINTSIKYVSSISKKESVFKKSSVKVCTYYPEGTILVDDKCKPDGKNMLLLDEKEEGYVFPISLQHKDRGPYNYYLNFENIGVGGDDTDCNIQPNRLMGCQNRDDVYTSETNKEDKYKCQYGSCPDCDVDCVCPPNSGPGECYVEDKVCKYITCKNCVVECVGCLWNDGSASFGYKTVSLNDVFPNSNTDEVGYNWNTDPNKNPQAEKAKTTLEEIKSAGEKAYEKIQYSYKLTPTVMGQIRSYNKEANKSSKSSAKWNGYEIPNGGYSNDTLTCTNGIHCTSSFLDGLDKILSASDRTRNIKWEEYDNGSSWK